MSSLVILDFNKDIFTTLLIHIDTLSMLISHFLRSLLCSLPPTLSVLMSYLDPFFILYRIPHLYLRLLHLDHCMFIFVALRTDTRPSTNSSPMVPSSLTSVLSSLVDLPIAVRKGTCSSRNPHPIYNFLTYHRLS